MSPNLIEFLKVFSIVVSFSSLILLGHSYMWKLTEEEGKEDKKQETDNVLNFPSIAQTNRNVSSEPDIVDYD